MSEGLRLLLPCIRRHWLRLLQHFRNLKTLHRMLLLPSSCWRTCPLSPPGPSFFNGAFVFLWCHFSGMNHLFHFTAHWPVEYKAPPGSMKSHRIIDLWSRKNHLIIDHRGYMTYTPAYTSSLKLFMDGQLQTPSNLESWIRGGVWFRQLDSHLGSTPNCWMALNKPVNLPESFLIYNQGIEMRYNYHYVSYISM